MNISEEIKALKLRMTLLEWQNKQAQKNYSSPQCPKCAIAISQKEPGSCQYESCPCGLN